MSDIDWYTEMTQPRPVAAPSPDKTDWYSEITRGQEMRAAPFKAKPVADDSAKGASALTAARASLAPDVADQIKRFAASRFPDMPLEMAVRRYGVIDGNIVYADQDGNFAREVPSVTGGEGVTDTLGRAGKWLASQAGPAIPAGAAAVAGTVMGPTGASIPVAGGAAAIADVGRQALDRALAGESVTDIDPLNAAGQALLNAGGQGAGVGFTKLMTRNPLGVAAFDKAAALDPAKRAEISALEAEAKRRGIDLTAGQATNMRSLKVQERQLGRKPETMDIMADFAERQQGEQVPAAIRAEIDSITGKPVSAETGINQFRTAAADVEKAANEARQAAASPLYQEAFGANRSVASPLIDRIVRTPAGKDALQFAIERMQNRMTLAGVPDPELTAALKEAVELGKADPSKGGVASGLKLETWDLVKQGLGEAERAAKARALNGNGKMSDARDIGDLRRALTKELDRLDITAQAGPNSLKPEGGAYARARAAFGDASEEIDALKDGGVGFINKMSGMDRRQIVERVFSGQNMLPEEVARIRAHFASAGKLPDFEAGMSVWLSDKLADAMKVNASGSAGNVAGKFYKSVWGDPRQREIVRSALGPEKSLGVEKLMDVIQAAARSLPEGSPTATDMGSNALQGVGRGLQVAGKLASPQTYLNAGTELVAGVNALREPAARVRLAEALTSGDYARELARLRMLPVQGEKAATLAATILSSVLAGASGARTPSNRPIRDKQPVERATP